MVRIRASYGGRLTVGKTKYSFKTRGCQIEFGICVVDIVQIAGVCPTKSDSSARPQGGGGAKDAPGHEAGLEVRVDIL